MRMKTLTQFAVARCGKPFFSRNELALWVGGSANRRDALLRRALASGEIERIRRGLYHLSPPFQQEKPNPLSLAQHIYGPSYISLESALSFHGLVPEAVYTVASVSLSRSRVFETPVGRFDFVRVPQRCFYAGVERHELSVGGGHALVASPLKALADYVHVRRIDESLDSLIASLRIEVDLKDEVSVESVDELNGNYAGKRIRCFLQQVREVVL